MPLRAPQSRIMLALDTPDRQSAFRVLGECADIVDCVKLNYPLVLTEGLGIVGDLKKRWDLPVVADFKIADVPVTNNRIAGILRDVGMDGVLAHGFIGSDALLELIEILQPETSVFVVTELTHPGGLEFTRAHCEDFARLAVTLGADGIQAPGTRPDQIRLLRKTVGPETVVISCGVGAQGGTMQETIAAGADFAIVGRGIYDSPDPRAAAAAFAGNQPAAMA
jgi:orotidine 5'-phosphate decarboxylase subfamily 1